MKNYFFLILMSVAALFTGACQNRVEINQNVQPPVAVMPPAPEPPPKASPTPAVPNLQAELTDDRNKTTDSPIGSVDFKNYTYPLPHGWQNPDGSDITLVNGRLSPVGVDANGDLSDEEKVDLKSRRRIGMSYVTTKFIDVTGDGQSEAIVILKIGTGGSAIPQIVYVFEWKNKQPELIWSFRTGDRADGGLKDIYHSEEHPDTVVVELFGQDRFLLGQMETGKITGDYEQLCCPTHYTRSFYKWNGKVFLMQGKRQTWSFADASSPPLENMGDTADKKKGAKK
jgi:hypothetical protein